MKTTNSPASGPATTPPQRPLRSLFYLLVGVGTLALFGFGTRQTNKGFVAHEWGTFTSVQGADGVLLDWKPLESSKLPGFVYDWKKPGLNRAAINPFAGSKGR